MAWFSRVPHLFSASGAFVGRKLLGLLTARSVVVVSTTCGILYALTWLVALLQTNGLIATPLPFPVADQVILGRSGGPMRPLSAPAGQQIEPAAGAQRQSAVDAAQASSVTLEIQAQSPDDLWVIDSHGGTIGTNPETGLVRLQIAGATYSGRGTSPEIITIPNAQGTYRVQLSGQNSGSYELQVRSFAGDDIEHAVKYRGNGEIFADSVLEALANVATRDDGSPDLQVSAVQVLVGGHPPEAPAPANALSSPPASPAAGVSLAGGAGALPQPPSTGSPGATLVASKPAVVLRPQAPARLPIPLPVPAIQLASPAAAAD